MDWWPKRLLSDGSCIRELDEALSVRALPSSLIFPVDDIVDTELRS